MPNSCTSFWAVGYEARVPKYYRSYHIGFRQALGKETSAVSNELGHIQFWHPKLSDAQEQSWKVTERETCS